MSVTLAGEEHTIRVVDYDKHNSVAVVRLNKPTQTKQTNKQTMTISTLNKLNINATTPKHSIENKQSVTNTITLSISSLSLKKCQFVFPLASHCSLMVAC